MRDNALNYALYIDDVGSSMPGTRDDFPNFGLGGIIVNREDESSIKNILRNFKNEWGIPQKIPLHGSEIRARKERYHWLATLQDDEVKKFKIGILEMVLKMPIVIHACVIDREGYYNRYYEKYGRSTWNMRQTACQILLERSVKFVKSRAGKSLTVFFEMCGSTEDKLFKETYNALRSTGHQFNSQNAQTHNPLLPNEISEILNESPKGRKKDNELLQIADMCLFPVAIAKGKDDSTLKRLNSSGKVVDGITNDKTSWIKYSCFDT